MAPVVMRSGRDSRDLLPLVNLRELSSSLHSWNTLCQKSLIDGFAIGEEQSHQSAGHVKPSHLYDYPDQIIQIALEANK